VNNVKIQSVICQKCTCRKSKRRIYLSCWFNKPTWWCGEADSIFSLKVCRTHTDTEFCSATVSTGEISVKW